MVVLGGKEGKDFRRRTMRLLRSAILFFFSCLWPVSRRGARGDLAPCFNLGGDIMISRTSFSETPEENLSISKETGKANYFNFHQLEHGVGIFISSNLDLFFKKGFRLSWRLLEKRRKGCVGRIGAQRTSHKTLIYIP